MWKRDWKLLVAFFVVLATTSSTGMAAEATPTVDFSPLLQQLIEMFAAILTAVTTWAVAYGAKLLHDKWGLDVDAAQRAFLEQAIANGIAYAKNKASTGVAGTKIAVQNELVKIAGDYVTVHAFDALKYFGVDEEALKRKIIAKLPPV